MPQHTQSSAPMDFQRFRSAVEWGDADVVQEWLKRGGSPDGDENFRPLVWAVARNHDRVLRMLLSAGADANLAHKDGLTPLMSAASKGDLASVESLLPRSDASRVSDAGGMRGYDAAMHAASSREPGAVGCLKRLAPVSDLTRVDHRGRNALLLAAEAGNPLAVEFLGEREELMASLDSEGLSALHIAGIRATEAVRGSLADRAFAWLAQKAPAKIVNAQDSEGKTALMAVLELGAIDHAQRLIDRPDCDLSLKDHQGRTAWLVAVDHAIHCEKNALLQESSAWVWAWAEKLSESMSDSEVATAIGREMNPGHAPRLSARVEALALRIAVDAAKSAVSPPSDGGGSPSANQNDSTPAPARRL